MTTQFELNQNRQRIRDALSALKDMAAYDLECLLNDDYIIEVIDRALWTAQVRHAIRRLRAAAGNLDDLLAVLDWGAVPVRDVLDDDVERSEP